LDQILQDFYKLRSGGLQLLQMVERKTLQEPFAVTGQLDQHLASIVGGAQATEKTSIDESID
jgi:hypothetical protein